MDNWEPVELGGAHPALGTAPRGGSGWSHCPQPLSAAISPFLPQWFDSVAGIIQHYSEHPLVLIEGSSASRAHTCLLFPVKP